MLQVKASEFVSARVSEQLTVPTATTISTHTHWLDNRSLSLHCVCAQRPDNKFDDLTIQGADYLGGDAGALSASDIASLCEAAKVGAGIHRYQKKMTQNRLNMLQSPHCRITKLYLWGCKVSDSDLAPLYEALKACSLSFSLSLSLSLSHVHTNWFLSCVFLFSSSFVFKLRSCRITYIIFGY